MAERKLDIFRVLGAADAKNAKFYAQLSDDERKEFQPFVVARWMSGTSNTAQVMMINEFLNPYLFTLTGHKELLWQLLTICNAGKSQRYKWHKLPGKRESGRPNAIKAVRQYFKYSTREAVDALDILTRSDVIEIAEELGWQPDDIAKIRREIKASADDKPEKAKSKAPPPTDLIEY